MLRQVVFMLFFVCAHIGFTNSAAVAGVSHPTNEAVEELRHRWNKAAESVANKSVERVSLLWTEYDNFPHPTFAGGTEQSYRIFAKVLRVLLADSNNMNFIRQNDLRELALHYSFGSEISTFGNFLSLLRDFSFHLFIEEEDRRVLQLYVQELSKN